MRSDDTEGVAIVDVVNKVGPKGYIHGWIKVGSGGEAADAVARDKKGQVSRTHQKVKDALAKSGKKSVYPEFDYHWSCGEGALKIAWTQPGGYDRALNYLGKYISDDQELRKTCSRLHYKALGGSPENSAIPSDDRS